MTTNSSKENSSVFFGQIDTYDAIKDYQRGGRCVRVYAVEENFYDIQKLSSAEGVPVKALEISFWRYCRSVLGSNSWITLNDRMQFDLKDKSREDRLQWYRFEVAWGGDRRDGYAYPAFGEEAPQYFELISSELIGQGHPLRPAPKQRRNILKFTREKVGDSSLKALPNWTLTSYHVGQGMCSLLSNGISAILLDCGAGTPIKRPNYLHSSTFINELSVAIAPLKKLDVVLSHADSDHWRLLGWDSKILSKVRHIYVASGSDFLALKDYAISGKAKQVVDLKFVLSEKCSLFVYRSQPAILDNNSDCLVAVLENDGKRALVAGDYVYERYKTDSNTAIKALHGLDFDAIVVPHHGDLASADEILPARSNATAFFSAGDHKSYKHPTAKSLSNHVKAKYRNIEDRSCPDIRGVRLI